MSSELQRIVEFVEARLPQATGFSTDGTNYGSLQEVWATHLADGKCSALVPLLLRRCMLGCMSNAWVLGATAARNLEETGSRDIKWYADAFSYWEVSK